MKKNKRNPVGNVNVKVSNCEERIIEMVEKVDNQEILEYLHTFIKLFLEKWG